MILLNFECQQEVSPKTTVKSKEKKQTKPKHVTIKQSPVLHKVLKGGDTVALLIRLEAKLLHHIHMVDGRVRVGFAAAVYAPVQIGLRNATIHFLKGSSDSLKREKLSRPERTCP